MLEKLSIQNYILIKELEIEPDGGMNVVTGETGAGKSILLGAIGLLMGQRADTKTLYDESQKCVIEGQFLLKDEELKALFAENDLDFENPCLIRREISPAGKSRAFVNDTPVNLEQLAEVVRELLDIHSQHETILLKKQHYQLQVLDGFAQNTVLKSTYIEKYKDFRMAEKQYEELLNASKMSSQELDYLSFVFKELEAARIEIGEQEKWEEEQGVLENSGEIKDKLAQAHALLDGEELSLLTSIQGLSTLFDQLSRFSQEYVAIKEKLFNIRFELRDINRQVESLAERTEIDPQRLQEIQGRLDVLYRLQRKHGVNSEEELLKIQSELEEKLSKIVNREAELEIAQTQLAEAERAMRVAGIALSASRKSVVEEFEASIRSKLALLGMSNATFQIQVQEQAAALEGLDKVVFLFSANKGIPPRPMADVASGGEFSRLMLAIKYLLATKKQMPTIIFDEIDTGISGEVAHNMAEMLEGMATRHQVFTITHLPQMASKGAAHFFVYKDDSESRTMSHIRKLKNEERVHEIAKMIGGKAPSESAFQHAKEMLFGKNPV
jgi:DNA repair protein RecN (Recombination protein N)